MNSMRKICLLFHYTQKAKYITKQCVFCNRSHKEQFCQIVKKPLERKRVLLIERRCFVCLKTGHNANNCKSNIKCFDCKGRHNVSICLQKEKNEDKESETTTKESNQEESKDKFSGVAAGESEESETNTFNNNVSNHVFLQTATANISNKS